MSDEEIFTLWSKTTILHQEDKNAQNFVKHHRYKCETVEATGQFYVGQGKVNTITTANSITDVSRMQNSIEANRDEL